MPSTLRSALAGLAAGALAASGLMLGAAPGAHAASAVRDVLGADRYETSVAVAKDVGFATGGTVFIASGLVAADALAAGPAAASVRAPILLALPGALPSAVRDELVRLAPRQIIIVGSEATLGPDVLDAAQAAAPGAKVERVGGTNRLHTAALIAERWLPSAPGAILANGWSFADAVSAAAAGARRGVPVLLTAHGSLAPEARDRLAAQRPGTATALGSASSIAESVLDEVRRATGGAADRIGGVDRYETNALVMQRYFAPSDSTQGAAVATGLNFPDALVASAYGRLGVPVLLAPAGCSTGPTRRMLDRFARNDSELIRRVGGAVQRGAWDVSCRIPADPYLAVGMARYDASSNLAGRAFVRMNDIRAEHGLPPIPLDRVRVGVGPFSQRSTDMVQNILDVRAGTAAPMDSHAGLFTANEVVYRNSYMTFHDLRSDGMVDGWWDEPSNRDILFQPLRDLASGGPRNPNAVLVLNFSMHDQAGSWDGAYDARATWILRSSSSFAHTVPIAEVDGSLRDYLPPQVPAGAAYDASRRYGGYVHALNRAEWDVRQAGGQNTPQFPTVPPMGPPPPQRI